MKKSSLKKENLQQKKFLEIEAAISDEFDHFISFFDHDSVETEPYYHPKRKKEYLCCYYRLYRGNLCYSFCYTLYAQPYSTLCMRICLKDSAPFSYRLEDFIALSTSAPVQTDYNCFYFPYLKTAEEGKKAFRFLASSLLQNEALIEKTVSDPSSLQALMTQKIEEIQRVTGMSPLIAVDEEHAHPNEAVLNYYELYLTRCYASKEYAFFLKGNYEASIAGYESRKQLTAYEKKLLSFQKELLATGETIDPLKGLPYITQGEILKISQSSISGPTFFLTLPIFTVLFALLFVGLLFLGNHFLFGTPIHSTNTEFDNLIFFLTPGLLLACCASFFLSRFIHQKKNDDRKKKQEAYRVILGLEKKTYSRGFAVVAVLLSILVSIFMFVLIQCDTVAFFDDHFVVMDIAEENLVIPYDDVKAIYRVEKRLNGFDEEIYAPSYIFCLRNGSVIDLYLYGSLDAYEPKISPLLQEQEITLIPEEFAESVTS